MAFWGLKVEPKTWVPFVPPPEELLRLHVSQVRTDTWRDTHWEKSRSRHPPPPKTGA